MIGLHLHRRHLSELGIKYFTRSREWDLEGKRMAPEISSLPCPGLPLGQAQSL
jgi:hypothetical protein